MRKKAKICFSQKLGSPMKKVGLVSLAIFAKNSRNFPHFAKRFLFFKMTPRCGQHRGVRLRIVVDYEENFFKLWATTRNNFLPCERLCRTIFCNVGNYPEHCSALWLCFDSELFRIVGDDGEQCSASWATTRNNVPHCGRLPRTLFRFAVDQAE